MTGPEHYREAEGLLARITDRDVLTEEVVATMAVAQVHATLALAAQNVPPPVIVHVEGDVKPEQLRRLINEASRSAARTSP
jgi:hypothetical protein